MKKKSKVTSQHMSVANDITALALINVQDIFSFVLTAKDSEIEERYVTEERALAVAEKYMDIAEKAQRMETIFLHGWSMTYSQPLKDSNDRVTKKAYFYNKERGGKA